MFITKNRHFNVKRCNNNRRMAEIKILKKHNPDNYTAIIFTNKTHYIFDMIEPAKEIIEQIKSIIPFSF